MGVWQQGSDEGGCTAGEQSVSDEGRARWRISEFIGLWGKMLELFNGPQCFSHSDGLSRLDRSFWEVLISFVLHIKKAKKRMSL